MSSYSFQCVRTWVDCVCLLTMITYCACSSLVDTSIGQSVKKFFGFGKVVIYRENEKWWFFSSQCACVVKSLISCRMRKKWLTLLRNSPLPESRYGKKNENLCFCLLWLILKADSSSQVESEIEYETDNPQFNTILSVPFQVRYFLMNHIRKKLPRSSWTLAVTKWFFPYKESLSLWAFMWSCLGRNFSIYIQTFSSFSFLPCARSWRYSVMIGTLCSLLSMTS